MAESSVFSRKFDPLYQVVFALAGVLIINILGMGLKSTDTVGVHNRFPWMTAASFMLFYAVFNAVFSVTAKNLMRYWGRSIYAFMALAVGAGLIAWGFSGLTIFQAGSYMWIYIVVTFGYLVFLSMVTIMRKVVEFAQREEWNSPKIRQKKRKR